MIQQATLCAELLSLKPFHCPELAEVHAIGQRHRPVGM